MTGTSTRRNWRGKRKEESPHVPTFLFSAEEGGLRFGLKSKHRATVSPQEFREAWRDWVSVRLSPALSKEWGIDKGVLRKAELRFIRGFLRGMRGRKGVTPVENSGGVREWRVIVSDKVVLPGRKSADSFERVLHVSAKSASAARRSVIASGVSANRIVRVEEGNPGKKTWRNLKDELGWIIMPGPGLLEEAIAIGAALANPGRVHREEMAVLESLVRKWAKETPGDAVSLYEIETLVPTLELLPGVPFVGDSSRLTHEQLYKLVLVADEARGFKSNSAMNPSRRLRTYHLRRRAVA